MTPTYIPTESQRRLDAEVARLRCALINRGHALDAEKHDSLVASEPGRTLSVADAMPEAMAVFERMEASAKRFFAEVRPQFDAGLQKIRCDVHDVHGVDRWADFTLTCQATRDSGVFTMVYKPCPECVRAERLAALRIFWSCRGIPERVIEAAFNNFEINLTEKMDALAKVRAWLERRGNFLLLTGGPGTGKGHLAAACLRSHGNGLWIEHVAMLGDLRASYTLHTTRDLIETWQEAEMLVLDEFGLSPGGRDEEPLLYQVLADRYDKRRPTILTSNLDKPSLREAVGYRLLDRIREDCVEVVMNWPSYRSYLRRHHPEHVA